MFQIIFQNYVQMGRNIADIVLLKNSNLEAYWWQTDRHIQVYFLWKRSFSFQTCHLTLTLSMCLILHITTSSSESDGTNPLLYHYYPFTPIVTNKHTVFTVVTLPFYEPLTSSGISKGGMTTERTNHILDPIPVKCFYPFFFKTTNK